MPEPRVPGLSIATPSRVLGAVIARWRRGALDQELVSELLARYGVIASRPPRIFPFGAQNAHALVTIPSGRKEVGFPSVRVNPTLSGDTVVASAGRLHALFDFAETVERADLPRVVKETGSERALELARWL